MSSQIPLTVLFDFEPVDDNELGVKQGETVYLINKDVGDGWWEVSNGTRSGIIPADFVQEASRDSTQDISHVNESLDFSDSDSDTGSVPARFSNNLKNINTFQRNSIAPLSVTNENAKIAIIRKVFPRNLSRPVAEEFFSDSSHCPQEKAQTTISLIDEAWQWVAKSPVYTCQFASFKKDSKLHGIKSFIAYDMVPSISKKPISRRYKQFCWLHERLVKKFPFICIPPLPEKNMTSRYEEDFIDDRYKRLQHWVSRMCSHPVVSNSPVFLHFMTCIDSKKWKQGKREAEADLYQGLAALCLVYSPDPLSNADVVNNDAIEKYTGFYEKSMKNMTDSFVSYHEKLSTIQMKQFDTLKNVCGEIVTTLKKDPIKYQKRNELIYGLEEMVKAYHSISLAHKEKDENTVLYLDILREYSGLSASLHPISSLLKIQHGVNEEINKAASEDRISNSDGVLLRDKCTLIGRSVKAELHHHSILRTNDWKAAFHAYLLGQAKFYEEISHIYKTAADKFEFT